MIKLLTIFRTKKIESLQYNAALDVTGAIRGTSREKIYQELGLESLQQRRWYRKLGLFFNFSRYIKTSARNAFLI